MTGSFFSRSSSLLWPWVRICHFSWRPCFPKKNKPDMVTTTIDLSYKSVSLEIDLMRLTQARSVPSGRPQVTTAITRIITCLRQVPPPLLAGSVRHRHRRSKAGCPGPGTAAAVAPRCDGTGIDRGSASPCFRCQHARLLPPGRVFLQPSGLPTVPSDAGQN